MKPNEVIAQQFVKALNEGTIPWNKPWQVNLPRNVVSGKAYNGTNRIILALFGNDDWFLTFNQAKSLGGSVKAGSKGIPICFYSVIEKKDANGDDDSFRMLRYFLVFRAGDCDLPKWKRPSVNSIQFVPITRCEEIISKQSAVIHENGNQACYRPSEHAVYMPSKGSFVSVEKYYHTLFHEMMHREAKVINAEHGFDLGGEGYALEELTAEIGAAYLVNYCGIYSESLFDHSKAYIQNWAKALGDNPQMIIKASSQAQKRFDSMMVKAGLAI